MEKGAVEIDALEELTREHRAALLHLDTLQGALAGLQEANEETSINSEALNAVEAAVQALGTDLGMHLRKEEEVLFPALSAHLGCQGGPVGVMLLEHEDLRRSLRALNAALGALRTERQSVFADEVLKVGAGLIGLLRQHIRKEDECLFPMAGLHLDRHRLLALGVAMRTMPQ